MSVLLKTTRLVLMDRSCVFFDFGFEGEEVLAQRRGGAKEDASVTLLEDVQAAGWSMDELESMLAE